MSDESTAVEETTEATEPAAEPQVDPLEALSRKVDESINKSEEELYDPSVEVGETPKTSTTEETPEGEEPSKSSYQKLKDDLANAQKENVRLKASNEMDEAIAFVERNYPNARPSRITNAIKRPVPAEHLKTIARGSHEDYTRGALDRDNFWKAEIEKIRNTAKQTAEEETAASWGSPPTSSGSSGGSGSVSPSQFQEAVRSRQLTTAQLEAMEDKIDWNKT
jgi:hypothetical protein